MFRSFSQAGQDAWLYYALVKICGLPRKDYDGFYLDVGCAQPRLGSNTFGFYERGWSGICIDANPSNQQPFVDVRPRDLYVCAGVGDRPGTLPFHIFSNPQHNTFDDSRIHKPSYLRTESVAIRTLSDILAETLPDGKEIDFMSMDVESYEMPTLRGMDFDQWRPKIVVVEIIQPIQRILQDPIAKHMQSNGYSLVSHSGHDAFFVDTKYL